MNFTWVFDVMVFVSAVLAITFLRPRSADFFKNDISRYPFTSRALSARGMWIFFNGALMSIAFMIWLLIVYQILTNGEVSAILAVKLFVVILAICANYSFGGEYKYSCSEKKNIQKFAIISCLLAVGMLGTSTNNLLIANMFLDTSSMLFAGLVIFGANFYEIEADRSYKIAFNYLVASAITSVCSYTGSALILLSTGTYNMQAAAVNITQSTSANGHLLFNAGVVLWSIKLLFMLGVFPFHYYVFSASRILTLPSNFFLFTSLKVPALFTALMLSGMIGADDSGFSGLLIVLCSAISIIVASFALYESFGLRHFLSASSVSAMSFTSITLSFGGVYSGAVASLNFIVYCVALSVFLLFYIPVEEASGGENKLSAGGVSLRTVKELASEGVFVVERWEGEGGGEVEGSVFVSTKWLEESRDKFGFSEAYHWRIVLTYISFCILSLGGVPFTAGFVGKFQVIGLLVHNDFICVATIIAAASAVSMVWYVMITFRLIAGTGIIRGRSAKSALKGRGNVFTSREVLNIVLVFILPLFVLILFTVFGMQGTFMQILSAGMLTMWP